MFGKSRNDRITLKKLLQKKNCDADITGTYEGQDSSEQVNHPLNNLKTVVD